MLVIKRCHALPVRLDCPVACRFPRSVAHGVCIARNQELSASKRGVTLRPCLVARQDHLCVALAQQQAHVDKERVVLRRAARNRGCLKRKNLNLVGLLVLLKPLWSLGLLHVVRALTQGSGVGSPVLVGNQGGHWGRARGVGVERILGAREAIACVVVRYGRQAGHLRQRDATKLRNADGKRLVLAGIGGIHARAAALRPLRSSLYPALRSPIQGLDLAGEPLWHGLARAIGGEVLLVVVHDGPHGIARRLPAVLHVEATVAVVQHIVQHQRSRGP